MSKALSLNNKLTLLSLLLCSGISHATQYVEKADERTVEVSVSSVEQNALVIEGGRIDTVIPSVSGALTYVKDTKNGVLYFAFADRFFNGTLSLFVTDENGQRYRLLLIPSKIAAEEVIIRPKKTQPKPSVQEGNLATSHHSQIKNMIYVMANDQGDADQELAGIEKVAYNKLITLWLETEFLLLDTYTTEGIRGERYQLTNISNKPLVLQEQEFYRKNVVAVAVQNLNLAPQQSTIVYIVRTVD